MRRAVASARRGDWPSANAAAAVLLDCDARYRRRMALDCGPFGEVLLDLPEAVRLADGDGLKLTDGSWIAVKAARESLLEVRLADPGAMLRIAWHLGNRHCQADISADRIRVRRDHVMEAMLRALGCDPIPAEATFNPERGAYHAADHGGG